MRKTRIFIILFAAISALGPGLSAVAEYIQCPDGPCFPILKRYVERNPEFVDPEHPMWIGKTVDMNGNVQFFPLGEVRRRATGENPFDIGQFVFSERVGGVHIALSDGRQWRGCWMDVPEGNELSPLWGEVSVGVINGTWGEYQNTPQCNLDNPDQVRMETGLGTLRFGQGARVFGAEIKLDMPDGRTATNCRIEWTGTGGTVTGGVIFPKPWDQDYLSMPLCFP